MKTQFNLIPPDYTRRSPLAVRFFALWGSLAAILVCGGQYFYFSGRLLNRLTAEAEKTHAAREDSMVQVALLNKKASELRAQLAVWRRLGRAAAEAVPIVETQTALSRALNKTARIESLTADTEKLRLEVIFVVPSEAEDFLRRFRAAPYGPLRVLERRGDLHGAVYFRFEGARRRETEKQ